MPSGPPSRSERSPRRTLPRQPISGADTNLKVYTADRPVHPSGCPRLNRYNGVLDQPRHAPPAGPLLPTAVGSYDYVYRYSTTNGRDWLYADLNGPIPGGAVPPNPGELTVTSSGDTTPPAALTGLVVLSASPAGIELDWDAAADAALYEVGRSDVSGGPYTAIATTTADEYLDTSVVEDATY